MMKLRFKTKMKKSKCASFWDVIHDVFGGLSILCLAMTFIVFPFYIMSFYFYHIIGAE